jgi:N-acetylmuramoyl-L-alanine amidase
MSRTARAVKVVALVLTLAASAVGLTSCATGPLRGKVVVLDAGHNGANWAFPAAINRLVWIGNRWEACDTTGTATNAGYPEHAFTFDVVNRVASELSAQGARVVLTRQNDIGVGPCIDGRAAVGNANHADLAISVHGDGAAAGVRGFHVIRPAYMPGYTSGIYGRSVWLAWVLETTYAADTGIPPASYVGDGGGIVERSDLGGLNLTRVPKVFIECGNMRNATDAAIMSSPVGRARIAHAISEGARRFLEGHS